MNAMLMLGDRKRQRGRTCHDLGNPDLAIVEARMASGQPFSRTTLDELRGCADHDGLCRRAIKRWRFAGRITSSPSTDGNAWWVFAGDRNIELSGSAAVADRAQVTSPGRAGRGSRPPEPMSRPSSLDCSSTEECGVYALPNGEIRVSARAVPGALLLARGPRECLNAEIARRAPRAFDSTAFAVPGTLWTKDETAIRRAAEVFSWFLTHALERRIAAPKVA